MKKKPLVILTGPTAVGKTALSIALAKATSAEIISADSMQVYRGMDIGSAKIKPEEMDGVRHHLIDVLDPTESFDVVRFQTAAMAAMEEIYSRGHIPLLVGGTGFYIQSVLYNIDFTENGNDSGLRKKYEDMAAREGVFALHRLLAEKDPVSAEHIPPQNVKRVVRALTFYEQSGQPLSEHNAQQRAKESPYAFAYFVLTDAREKLYARIDRRVDQMMEEGLEDEVRRLKAAGLTRDMVSMQGLGYKELLAFLDGELTKEEALRIIKRDTRHFAKRQLTWFRREKEVIWMDKQAYGYDDGAMLAAMCDILRERGITDASGNTV